MELGGENIKLFHLPEFNGVTSINWIGCEIWGSRLFVGTTSTWQVYCGIKFMSMSLKVAPYSANQFNVELFGDVSLLGSFKDSKEFICNLWELLKWNSAIPDRRNRYRSEN